MVYSPLSAKSCRHLSPEAGSGNYLIDHDGKEPSVTTARTEHWLMAMILLGVTHVTFIIPERVCLSWRISPKSSHTVNSVSSMSDITRVRSKVDCLDGGCHVTNQR